MSAGPSRRAFLRRAGAASAGVLAASTGVLAATHTLVPAPHSEPLDAAWLARVHAVLDRPTASVFRATGVLTPGTTAIVFDCSCARCRAIRTSGIQCPSCGFEGAPVVVGCSCVVTRAGDIAFYRQLIAARYPGTRKRRGLPSLALCRTRLAEALATPEQPCLVHREAAVRARRRSCGHGEALCPTCGNGEAGEITVEKEYLAEMIRELRQVLRAERGRA